MVNKDVQRVSGEPTSDRRGPSSKPVRQRCLWEDESKARCVSAVKYCPGLRSNFKCFQYSQ